MMKLNLYLKIIPLAVSALLFLNTPAMAEKVNNYNHLYAMLVTKGASQKFEIKEIVEAAQKEAIIKQKRYNKITFGKPLEVHFLNTYYIAISFQATIFTTSIPQEAVFTLLFFRRGENNLEYEDEFLLWIGKREVSNYLKLDKKGVCEHFHEMLGRDVCVEAIQTAENQEPPVPDHTHKMTDIQMGIIKEPYIDQSVARVNWVNTMLKSKSDVKHTHPEFSKITSGGSSEDVENLKKQVAQLEQTVRQLKTLLNGVTREGDDITFKSVNVHIVNGTGKTDGPVNGLGNLIVGYNESNDRGAPIPKNGSHNIVVGSKNGYSSYGGLVVGLSNTISGRYSAVSGGSGNIAKGDYSSVSGGHLNVSKGNFSSVSGGLNRTSSENNSWRGGEQSSTQ